MPKPFKGTGQINGAFQFYFELVHATSLACPPKPWRRLLAFFSILLVAGDGVAATEYRLQLFEDLDR